MPRVVSLFAGIGGFDLGFERAGFEVTLQCEIDDFCQRVLKEHWPSTTLLKDIRRITSADIPVSEVWAGGFPCQDVSVARMGPRAGLKGRKSGLFYEFSRLIEEGRPRICVIENVPGLLSSHGGRDFRIILNTLAKIGYGVGWRVLNSRYFGVPQSRSRVFIVGCYRDRLGPAEILFEPKRRERNDKASGSNGKKVVSPFKRSVGDSRKGPLTPELAYCLYACSARHTGTDWSRNYVSYPKEGKVRRYTPLETERLQGFPDGWTALEDKSGDAEDLDTPRYQVLGNAVTPQVAEWLARRIKLYLQKNDSESKLAGKRTEVGRPHDLEFVVPVI